MSKTSKTSKTSYMFSGLVSKPARQISSQRAERALAQARLHRQQQLRPLEVHRTAGSTEDNNSRSG